MKNSIQRFNNLKVICALTALAMTSGMAVAAPPPVWDGSLPTAGDPLTSQQYQDFTVYSLNYLSNLSALNSGLLASPTYNVDSTKAKIADYVVLATNGPPAESNLTPCGATGCDQAYYSNVTGLGYPQNTYFQSSSMADPTVLVPGEPTRSTWTATTSALKTYLAGQSMVFMFNLNEDGGGLANTLDGQALLVSMRVQLTNAAGDVLYSFYVGANNAIGLPQTAAQLWGTLGAPDPDPLVAGATVVDTHSVNGYISTDARWGYVHGAISVDKTTGKFLGMGDCVFTGFANCDTINQNLGADQVAFSAFNQQLSDLIYDSRIAFMNVDFTTAGQSNGHEQLFIMAAKIPRQVPEPGSIALLGLALAGLSVARRRKAI